jgi:hypothetical protein
MPSNAFAESQDFLFSEIEALISNGLRIANYYSDLFSATHHTSLEVKDHKYLLDAVRRDLERREGEIQKQFAAMQAAFGKPCTAS